MPMGISCRKDPDKVIPNRRDVIKTLKMGRMNPLLFSFHPSAAKSRAAMEAATPRRKLVFMPPRILRTWMTPREPAAAPIKSRP